MAPQPTQDGSETRLLVLIANATTVLVVLRANDVIDWSWWLALAPAWGSVALGLAIMAVAFIIERWP